MGYIAVLLMGISLGLIGAGGSILTVPVLVYLFGVPPLVATSYSLFVVGSTSFIGSINSYRKGWVDWRTVLLFGASSVITVFLIRRLIIPLIPVEIHMGRKLLESQVLLMILFAVIMILASLPLISKIHKPANEHLKKPGWLITIYGIGIGLITGLLGVGGGFLLVPALIFLLNLPIQKAIGTSLLIIAVNSSVGFIADAGSYAIDWVLLISVSVIAIFGGLIGARIGVKLNPEILKKGFGWLILAMGLFIFLKETL